jgi:cytochrome b6-f complex iron-sulfur subunit
MFSPKQKDLSFEKELPRRSFFRLTGLALGMGVAALGAVFGLWTAALARFMVPNATGESDLTFKAGYPGEYLSGKVDARFKDRYQTWIVPLARDGRRKFIALRAVCTHLGCVTIWNDNENRFRCPCHGSGFSLEGINLEGPAPRPLDRYAIRLAEDGQLEIDRSKVFGCDREWKDVPESYVEI